MARIGLWFPHGFWPPAMGSQIRVLELVRAVLATGHELVLLAGDNPPASRQGWTPEGFSALRGLGVADIRVHRSRIDDFVTFSLRKSLLTAGIEPALDSWVFMPPMLRRWFARQVRELRPDVMIMNYSTSHALVEASGFPLGRCLLETHDLVSLNKRMVRALARRLPPPPYDPARCPRDILGLDWFARQGFGDALAEPEVCARFGGVMSISSREAESISRAGGRVRYVPMSMEPADGDNSRDGAALLATGPNPFNVQGYLWFASEVLPRLREAVPDFVLGLSGTLSFRVAPVPGVRPVGYVDEIRDLYGPARFAVCPVFGGTGQQVKIVEAMAHGVAVVALEEPSRESPIAHGINGLVAKDAAEFARHCAALWVDAGLRRRLGEEARRTIARTRSAETYRGQVREALDEILDGAAKSRSFPPDRRPAPAA